jgi:polyhydroxyalkanoate synthesis repressor PhaR
MSNDAQPITIKKYANRRLYNTGASAYVTLEDLAELVKKGEDFVVFDAKTGEDITRSVLAQIIFEQEGKVGQSLLPITFLRQIIRFYGDSMQMLVPSYLEFSIERFANDQQKFRDQIAKAFGAGPGRQMFDSMEEQTRKNMAVFNQALAMFNPFVAQEKSDVAAKPAASGAKPANEAAEIDNMKTQLVELQKRLDELARKR